MSTLWNPQKDFLLEAFVSKVRNARTKDQRLLALNAAFAVGRAVEAKELPTQFYSLLVQAFEDSYNKDRTLKNEDLMCDEELRNNRSNHVATGAKAIIAFIKKRFFRNRKDPFAR